MRTIAIANQKGGCGKTTTSVNLATAFAMLGRQVLIVDLDPQGHATLALGCDPGMLDKTIYHALTNARIPMPRVIISSNEKNLDLAPSNILLSGVELELATMYSREYILSQQLSRMNDCYDICIIDCWPSLSLLTLNALVASEEVIIPVQVQYYAIEGLRQLMETIDVVRQRFNYKLNILGILLAFVESRTILSRQIQRQMREFFGELVFDMIISRTVRLAEAPSAGQSIFSYAPECKGAFEYMTLAEEILNGKNQLASTCEMKTESINEYETLAAETGADRISQWDLADR